MTHDNWITGTGSVAYTMALAGLTSSELISSADASLRVIGLKGTLPHVVLDSEMGPLRVRSFSGRAHLQGGRFEISDSTLDGPGGSYQVSGTATLGGVLNLKLTRAHAGGFSIVGPLASPSVAPTTAAEARAALKP